MMRLATLSTWEKFAPCEEYGVFASNFNAFNKWAVGDTLIIFIGNEGLVETVVIGDKFKSNEFIWENDLYEWRLPIEIRRRFSGDVGVRVNRAIKDRLAAKYGAAYGYLLRNHTPLLEEVEKDIRKILDIGVL